MANVKNIYRRRRMLRVQRQMKMVIVAGAAGSFM